MQGGDRGCLHHWYVRSVPIRCKVLFIFNLRFDMKPTKILLSSLTVCALLSAPAFAQNKAAIGKSVSDFYKVSTALSASLTDLGNRTATASPNDKDMLKLATSQLGIANAIADGVLELGAVAAEVNDAGSLGIAKKHLTGRCNAMKSTAEATAKYLESLASNIAAVATAAEVRKSRDLLTQMVQHPLCNTK